VTVTESSVWVDVCPLEAIVPERGVAALVDGAQVAVFRLRSDELLAIANCDPFSGAHVLSRGLVGSVGDRVTLASPIYKQRFDLRTGSCLDDDAVSVAVYEARIADGLVQLRAT